MPRRVIRLGLQPSQFSFQDDYGPLTNGLASAAQSFFEGGQRRAELEMAREAQAKADARSQAELQRQTERDIAGDTFREREIKLREDEANARNGERFTSAVGGLAKGAGEFLFGTPATREADKRLALDREKFDYEKTKDQAKPSKTGSDAYTPDELKHRQMLADRELDAAGITTYKEDTNGHQIRKLAPGKTWNDLVPIYRKWNVLPSDVQDMQPAAAPVDTGSLQDATMQEIAPGSAPVAAPQAAPAMDEGMFGPAPTGMSQRKKDVQARIQLLQQAGIPNAEQTWHQAVGTASSWPDTPISQSLVDTIDPNLVDIIRPDWSPEKRQIFKTALKKLMAKESEPSYGDPQIAWAKRKIILDKAVKALRDE